MGRLRIDDLTVAYGKNQSVPAVSGVSIEVPEGGLAVLLGPSGCGKSTILNSVAGLLNPSRGIISVDGREVFNSASRAVVPPNRRGIGMVFQTYALWPHRTVADNVAYPLARMGKRGEERKARVLEALDIVRCRELAHRYPSELSGGQQQRVALARALAAEPSLILFDEPLSNLDAELRRELRDELAALHERLHFTGLYVTHDQAEALSLASQIHVINAGRVVQSGTPQQVHESPASALVAGFFGANSLPGVVTSAGVETAFGTLATSTKGISGAVQVGIYPGRIGLSLDAASPTVVERATYIGTAFEYVVRCGEMRLRVSSPSGAMLLRVDDHVTVNVTPSDVHAFPAHQDQAATQETVLAGAEGIGVS